ncbi:FG-GAP repeat protein [Planctomycetes bacterium MalM25]|nr:FG-GAP repeat protein [Planctomycetes bacterium MalM25]
MLSERGSRRQCYDSTRIIALASLVMASLGCQQGPGTPGSTPESATIDLTESYNRAVGQMGQFDYDGAVKTLETLLGAAPAAMRTTVQTDLAIALLNRRQGEDLERSKKLLDEVRAADPKNLRAPYCRALLEYNEGATATAQDLFRLVAEADPSDSYARYYVGQCLASTGDHRGALDAYRECQQIDPYLRSAYYGAFQAAQRLGDREGAKAALTDFQRLAVNPRARLAELKYTRMGPKAAVNSPASSKPTGQILPEGPTFKEPTPLPIEGGESIAWRRVLPGETTPSITVVDVNRDGASDLFITGAVEGSSGAPQSLLLIADDGKYVPQPESPLSETRNVAAALWGDFDDDGLTDVYLARRGPNQLWRQTESGQWEDVTESTGVAGGALQATDGAVYDLDHDGDLDYVITNADGPVQVFSNNRDGTFREHAEELGVAGGGRPTRRVLLADLDSDDDADILLLHAESPHEVLLNDRLWNYHAAEGFERLTEAMITAAVAADVDVDGRVELFTVGPAGLQRWGASSGWSPVEIASLDAGVADPNQAALGLFDATGSGELRAFAGQSEGWSVLNNDGETEAEYDAPGLVGPFAVINGDRGPEVIACRSGEPPVIWRAGPGRHPFALLSFSGRTDKAAEMRSNASGIGVHGSARFGERWAPIPESRPLSGPGQSLQPIAMGAGGAEKFDFIRLLWPDAVSQTELDLPLGERHDLVETQRQAGSCPLLFVWDGERYVFVADLLGAGGIGFNLGRGEYYPARPYESFLLPEGVLRPKGGRLVLKLGEPMEEICYFDAVRLVAYDLPPGWEMTLDERFGASEPLPTGEPRYYRRSLSPLAASGAGEEDVLAAVRKTDRRAAPLRRRDRRFIGMTDPHTVTLTFDQPLDELTAPTLLFDAWVEYPYSQTAFAAWQADAVYTEPTLEAEGADGRWREVFARFGYPAGTARESSAPIDPKRLPKGARRLRLTTNMQVYWDRLAIVDAEPCDEVIRSPAKLVAASVADVGFSERVVGPQRHTVYDYGCRPPFGDARHPRGHYTEFGEALELVEQTDDALAIIGPGEELHLEFDRPSNSPPPGWTRRWVVEADGWCKDADLFTQDAGTVQPLPRNLPEADEASRSRRETLHRQYNTRYRDGY